MNSLLAYLKKPLILGIFAGILGFGLGLSWGWGIQPVQWKDAPPSLLHAVYQEDYLRMTIDSYGLNGNQSLAVKRWESLGELAKGSLETIQQNPGSQDPTLIMQFSNLVLSNVEVATPITVTETPAASSSSSTGRVALIALAILAILVVLYAVIKFLKPHKPNTSLGAGTPTQQAGDYSRQVEMTDYSAIGEQSPIAQFVTTYVSGDDLFDDSFSIDSASGEFLGECGIGISETIGVGDPKKVSAFEVWMFDKNDIQTVTKVLMSAHAYNDPSTYQRLQAKGEPIMVERGQRVTLETATLQMIATISEIEYGQGALPAESFFNRVTLELAIWQKTSPIG
ncbi:MAG: hypothetical protein A2X25_12640 [Chloroflexi bacterium GWB2_49_20]|nr:MAG: hypothetical protein A2X25_12640 [Chloroflexi bacterium GWB2_49_20]OGN78434.1 MAG: hypothetical protein A2X26_01560 [Chloroflexi bacterium GWC2_49_37]OGN84103.1 MAG: hypothetical protein A2X27_14125 [Chloroflexi bacterium GWD2_49_16]HBG75248.1 hypothetical protein [Anaerolineae bacterium]HCC79117.1 hypothetical protein [Anaerolineae bacterium]